MPPNADENLQGLRGMRWFDADGGRTAAPDCSAAAVLKQAPEAAVYRVTFRGEPAALKLREHRTLRKIWHATRHRAVLDHERRMIGRAREADLPAPRLLGWGERRLAGLVVQQSLLTAFHDGRVEMVHRVGRAADSGDAADLAANLEAMVRFCARLRAAALSDSDFSIKHLLVDPSPGSAIDPLWIDLEAVAPAEPDDAEATARTLGSALWSWWVATRESEPSLRQALDRFRQILPQPPGGWDALTPRIEQVMQHKWRKVIRTGGAQGRPPSLHG